MFLKSVVLSAAAVGLAGLLIPAAAAHPSIHVSAHAQPSSWGLAPAVRAATTHKPTAGKPATGSGQALAVPQFPVAGPVPDVEQQLLDARVGFGGGVTGGAGGAVIHVTSDADSGPGSLRDALAGSAPRWIVFDSDMTIHLTEPLAVGDNVTVDGRGRDVQITGPNIDGLDLVGDSNVIVESLTLHDFGNPALTAHNNTPDAVHLDGASGVWIDHCDLSIAGDKLIAVTGGSTGLTVSWTHFHDQLQVFQVGNQTNGASDASQTVTIEHNFFDHTGYRNPVVSYGRAHVYDNYYLDWHLYGVRSQRVAQMYLEDNVFDAGDHSRASVVKPSGDGCNDSKTRCDDRLGYLNAVGNLLLDGAKIKSNAPQQVFNPAKVYPYTAEPATPALAAGIAAGVGPQS